MKITSVFYMHLNEEIGVGSELKLHLKKKIMMQFLNKKGTNGYGTSCT